jgi:predicted transposase/invertase (TIGR01784 family)
MTTHDTAYKQLFAHPRMVEDLLRGYVTEAWVGDIDFTTLERVADSFISDDLREREDDVIWRVRWGERWLYLYLLIEFQSTVDRFMAVRLLTYIGLLYQDILRANRPGREEYLPPVLPIVLYNGEERWWARTELIQLQEPQLPEGLARFQPDLCYLLLDENRLAHHPHPATRNLATALFGLESSRSAEDMVEVLGRLVEWLQDPAQNDLRRSFVTWLRRIGLKRHVPEQDFKEFHELQEIHAMLADRIDSWFQEWEKQGMQKGLAQGLQQGLQQGGSHLLLQQLRHRFGPDLPAWVEPRLQSANPEQLERWGLALLTANTLAEVFEDQEG